MALTAVAPPKPFILMMRPVVLIWLFVPLASSAVPPPLVDGFIVDPVSKMIRPPVCADAAVAQFPLMMDPALKVIMPAVSAKAPVLPPLKGLILTLLVVIWALVVAWTAGDPLSVVLGAIWQNPLVSVTVDGLPATVQTWAAALSISAPDTSRTSIASAIVTQFGFIGEIGSVGLLGPHLRLKAGAAKGCATR